MHLVILSDYLSGNLFDDNSRNRAIGVLHSCPVLFTISTGFKVLQVFFVAFSNYAGLAPIPVV